MATVRFFTSAAISLARAARSSARCGMVSGAAVCARGCGGAGGLKLEDPRLAMMMAAPPRRVRAAPEQRPFHYVRPRAGDLLLWESWLRHETERNDSKSDRLSVSFNYKWG